MALTASIHKFDIALSNFDLDDYQQLKLTVAQHPSETFERMLVRVLVFCLHAHREPEFTKGLSTSEDPDLWVKNPNGDIDYWIEVGEPNIERIQKICRKAKHTCLYNFNSKASTWFQINQKKLEKTGISLFRFSHTDIERCATQLLQQSSRSHNMSVSINNQNLHIVVEENESFIQVEKLMG